MIDVAIAKFNVWGGTGRLLRLLQTAITNSNLVRLFKLSQIAYFIHLDLFTERISVIFPCFW